MREQVPVVARVRLARFVRRPVYNRRLRAVARALLPAIYAGSAVECPCCGRSFRAFVPRFFDCMCPGCLSLLRHRLLWLYLRDRTDVCSAQLSLLHVSPEEGIERRLRDLPRLRYVSVDLDPSRAMVRADIQELPFEDRSFDVAICNHVLEHVPDDRLAMLELHRVLRDGGTLYTIHPFDPNQPETREDPTVTEPAERRALYAQSDHLRSYGADLPARLEAAGFEVLAESYARQLSDEAVARYGVVDIPIHACRKAPT
jgi:SAM-dependent methyltransferase